MPVVLDDERPKGVGMNNESVLTLSNLGRGHLLTRFDADEMVNDQIWKMLPGFYWSTAVTKSRPGTEVLAVHSELQTSSAASRCLPSATPAEARCCSWAPTARGDGGAAWRTSFTTGSGVRSPAGWRTSVTSPRRKESA